MSAINPTLREELCESNRAVESYLRGHIGMKLKAFKILKAATQFLAVAAGMAAMYLGAPPFLTFVGVVILVTGPEGLEYWIAQAGGPDVDRLRQRVDELEGEDRQ
jgi:uncharacterized membrane protein